MATSTYPSFSRDHLLRGTVDFAVDSFKVMLVTSAYTRDMYAQQFRSDITGEAAGTGYTAGGVALTNVAVLDNYPTDFRIDVDADDPVFPGVTLTDVVAAIFYKDTGNAATDPLISWHSFTAVAPTAEDLVLQLGANGFFTLWP